MPQPEGLGVPRHRVASHRAGGSDLEQLQAHLHVEGAGQAVQLIGTQLGGRAQISLDRGEAAGGCGEGGGDSGAGLYRIEVTDSPGGATGLINQSAPAPLKESFNLAKQNLSGVSEHVSGMVHQAIIAFQFYDKLVQRLAHVGLSLGDLSDLVADPRRLFNPGEWVGLQDKIKTKYSTREEIAMFDAVMQGMPVQEAVDKFMADMKEKSDDIELF